VQDPSCIKVWLSVPNSSTCTTDPYRYGRSRESQQGSRAVATLKRGKGSARQRIVEGMGLGVSDTSRPIQEVRKCNRSSPGHLRSLTLNGHAYSDWYI